MNWFKRILNFFSKGTYEIVYSTYGTWEVTYGDTGGMANKYCNYNILYNDITKHYKLETSGYQPTNHDMYSNIFKAMRRLNEGSAYIKGGDIYTKDTTKTNEQSNSKSVDSMNETECNVYLAKALEEENYELAERIKKRLEKL